MNVTISVPGKFPGAYHWARYLDARGELTRLVTTMPYGRARTFGVARTKTARLPPFAYWYHGFERYGPRWARPMNQLAYSALFDRAAARLIGDANVFNGWSTIALQSMRLARRRGATTVLQTGSTHIGWQTEVLRSESSRWKLEMPITHPALVARCVCEYEEADAIIVPSKFVRESFVAAGVPRSKVHIVPWAVWPLTAPPVDRPVNGRTRILFVGTCSIRKGVPYLLAAARHLSDNAMVRLVGPPDPRVVAAAGGLPSGVEVVGRRRGQLLADEYRRAEIFVLPSMEDGSAVVVAEAMAAGLPVVVSDRAGADFVVDGVNGFVVPAGDALALARRLNELVADPDLRARLGRNAAETVTSRSWETYGAELHEIFKHVVAS